MKTIDAMVATKKEKKKNKNQNKQNKKPKLAPSSIVNPIFLPSLSQQTQEKFIYVRFAKIRVPFFCSTDIQQLVVLLSHSIQRTPTNTHFKKLYITFFN